MDDASLRPAVEHLPAVLAAVQELQLLSEGQHVLPTLQQKDPSALVQARGLTDPHAALAVAHA